MDLQGFDATQVEPAAPRELLPAGKYKCAIVAGEEKPTKAQTGSYLNLTMEVLEGPFKGRKVYDLLNLNNPNKTAEEIAQRTLSAICHAVGVLRPRRSEELYNKPMLVSVKIDKAKDGYEPKNSVTGYEAIDGGPASSSGGSGGAAPPWKR